MAQGAHDQLHIDLGLPTPSISTSDVFYISVCPILERKLIQDCLLDREELAQPSKKSLVGPRPPATMLTYCN